MDANGSFNFDLSPGREDQVLQMQCGVGICCNPTSSQSGLAAGQVAVRSASIIRFPVEGSIGALAAIRLQQKKLDREIPASLKSTVPCDLTPPIAVQYGCNIRPGKSDALVVLPDFLQSAPATPPIDKCDGCQQSSGLIGARENDARRPIRSSIVLPVGKMALMPFMEDASVTAVLDTNLVDADLVASRKGPPLELFARWREHDPVHWNPAPAAGSYVTQLEGGSLDKGFWVLTRYEDVSAVSRDQKTFSSHLGGPTIWDFEGPYLERQRAGIMGMDIGDHMSLKKLVVPAFSPRVMKAFEPEIAKVAKEIVDGIAPAGEGEFIFDVASRLPVYTFCTILGVPEKDRDKIFQLGNALADVENEATDDTAVIAELFAYSGWLAQQKRENPDNSMMSIIVNSESDGERLSDSQIAMFFITMSIAGHETTRNTAAHFIRLMNEHPDQYELLKSDPDKYIPNAIDEVLRFSPPVIQFRRTATQDAMIGGQAIRKGDKVYLSYPAANRDPAIFADPDKFDILRPNANKHLAFGVGPHICLGARLAHIQLFQLLKQLVTRIPDIRIAGEMTYLRSIWFHAIMSMPVKFTPEH